MAEFIGALLGIYLLIRLILWLSKRLGDNERHIAIAHAVAFAVALIVGAYGLGSEDAPMLGKAATLYALPVILWLVVDLVALRGRRASRDQVGL